MKTNTGVRRICAVLLSICMMVTSIVSVDVPVWAVETATNDTAGEMLYEMEGCSVTYKVNNSWSNYVIVDMTVCNTGESTIRNWELSFEYDGQIDNIWSADVKSYEEGICTIVPLNYNCDINVGASVSFGFMAYGADSIPDLPQNLSVKGVQKKADDGDSNQWKSLCYALYSGSSKTLSLYTGKTSISGDIHSNGDFYYQGNTITVDKRIEAAGSISLKTSDQKSAKTVGEYVENAGNIALSPLTEIIKKRLENDAEIYEESHNFNTDNVVVEQSVYVKGSASFNTTAFLGQGIIHATDSIDVNVGSMATPEDSRVFFSSENGDITLNGTDFCINAVIYAPNGCVRINAGNITINGRIIAKSIEINGTVLNINATDKDFDILKKVLKPEADIKVSGETKQNRRVIIELSDFEGFDYISKESVTWHYEKAGEDAGMLVGTDEEISDVFRKEVLFREPGEYTISVTAKDEHTTYEFTKTIEISPDIKPEAKACLVNNENNTFLRDEEGKAYITLEDCSYSPDEDILGSHVITIYHDSNNDGEYTQEEIVYRSDDVSETVHSFVTESVGKYKVQTEVCEYFENTIPALIGQEDYLSDISEMFFEVINLKPEASFDVAKDKRADILVTIGTINSSQEEIIESKTAELKERLESAGVNVNLVSLDSSELTAQDQFAWKEYDHYNFNDKNIADLEKHIIIQDKDIVMMGYSSAQLKDFLYIEDSDPGQKILEFDMIKDKTDWHSMDGAGFLFNTDIDEENNRIDGYAILFRRNNCYIAQIACDDLQGFRDGKYSYVSDAGKFLYSVNVPSAYENHHYTVCTTPDTVSLLIDDKIYIDGYKLPQTAEHYGYGPIVSHVWHDCRQQSFFTFSNIVMKSVHGMTLDEIVQNNAWRNEASHYLLNVSEGRVSELADNLKRAQVAESLIENEVIFAGIGNSKNKSNYVSLISNVDDGMFIEEDDFETGMDLFCKRVYDDVMSRDYRITDYICQDEPINYKLNYHDPENDGISLMRWLYECDDSMFAAEGDEKEHLTLVEENPITVFNKAGAYTINLCVRDNAAGENVNLTEYNEWSDFSRYNRLLIVQNRPECNVSVNVSATQNSYHCYAESQYEAWDNDHVSDESKGIRQENACYKEITQADWTPGRLPSQLIKGKIYLVRYEVSDAEGSTSKPAVEVVNTAVFKENPVITDTTPPEIEVKTAKDRYSVGENILIDAYATDESGIETFYVYVNGNCIRNGMGYLNYIPKNAGTLKVKATAKDIKGNRSEKTIELNIYDSDVTPPKGELKLSVSEKDGSENLLFIVTATDETSLGEYEIEYKRTDEGQETEYKSIFKSGKAVTEEIVTSLPVEQLEVGNYEARLTVSDTAGNKAYCTAIFKIEDSGAGVETPGAPDVPVNPDEPKDEPVVPGDDADTCVPEAVFMQPEADSIISEPVYITGTAKDETSLLGYELEYRLQGDDEFTLISKGEEPVENDTLGYFDVSVIPDGIYEVRLTATDEAGHRVRTTRTYQVHGGYKAGEMFLGFTDYSTKLSEVTFNVNRYYSSLNKSKGDFGYGWTLGLTGLTLYQSSPLTEGYRMEQSGNYFNSYFEMVQTRCHDVILDYGDGNTDRFVLKVTPQSRKVFPIYEVNLEFECVTGHDVKLEFVTDTTARVYSNQFLFYDERMYDDIEFVLTTREGNKIYFTQKRGVTKIMTKTGETITVDDNGIHSDDGNNIRFTRDDEGRIISVSGPGYRTIRYTYDERGNLAAVKDAAGNTVSYEYDDEHNITGITDPLGVTVARNEYDENGRLVAVIDAHGNRTEIEYDTEGRSQVVRDALGNTTVYTYDKNGNVLKKVDAYGNITTNTYDDYNNLLSTTDALGHTTTYERDGDGNVTKIIMPDGTTSEGTYSEKHQLLSVQTLGNRVLEFAYDEHDNMTMVTDGLGNMKNFTYDSTGKLTGITDAIGTYQTAEYDSAGNLISLTNGAGDKVTYKYDSIGRCTMQTITRIENGKTVSYSRHFTYNTNNQLTTSIDYSGKYFSYGYDSNGRKTYVTDELGRRTGFEYDDRGNLIRINYPDGSSESFGYDANGNNTKAVSRSGQTVTMEYDRLNRLVAKHYADGNVERYEYDAVGNVVATVSVTGARTEYTYDERNRNTSVKDGLGNETVFTYDSLSRLIKTTDALGNSICYTYDLNGNMTGITYADGNSITAEYDARNRCVAQTDANGNRTVYVYDGADRLTGVTDAAGGSYLYEYDSTGSLIKVTDANGNATAYGYDAMGRISVVTNAAGQSMSFAYDGAGNLVKYTDYAGTVTTYSYDKRDRMVKKVVGSQITTYKYNGFDCLTEIAEPAGKTTCTYDDYGRLLTREDIAGNVISYTYDAAGRVETVKNAKTTTTYSYDILGRITRVSDGAAGASYEYDAVGNLIKQTCDNHMVITYSYDNCNRLKEETVTGADNSLICSYTYTLGKCGERLSVTEKSGWGSVTTTFAYDKLNRLVSESITDGTGTLTNTYSYDAVSNRIKKTTRMEGDVSGFADDETMSYGAGSIVYTYNELNQLTKETSDTETVSYSYDDNGNLVKKSGSVLTDYSYDLQNRLMLVTVQSGNDVTTERYTYDALGNRISRTVNEEESIFYVTDLSGSLSEVNATAGDDGSIKSSYLLGMGLIALEKDDSVWYYVSDGHGSVRLLVSGDGAVTDRYDYDAYGSFILREGSTDNDFAYTGEQYNELTGLYYLRARYMDPSTGTFISMDTFPANVYDPVTLHRYLYANANPVAYTDPTGYYSLGELSVSSAISDTLASMNIHLTVKGVMEAANAVCVTYDMVNGVIGLLSGDGSLGEILMAAVKGAAIDWMMNYICNSKLAFIARPLFAIVGLKDQFTQIVEAAKSGDPVEFAIRVLQLTTMIYAMTRQCFVAGTLVSTDDGLCPIEAIKDGDYVWAEDTVTGEVSLKKVLKVFTSTTDTIVTVTTTDGEVIETTEGHPFYVEGRGWVAASELKAGDALKTKDGIEVHVESVTIEEQDEPVTIYNLEVEDEHTYFVSEGCVLVHNDCETGTVWDNIKETQDNYPNTNIPKSFEVDVNGKKMWVHGNATEHMYEDVYAKIMAGKGTAYTNPNLYIQQLMSDFYGSLVQATVSEIKYGEIIHVGNWEFIFALPRQEGLLPVIKHAQFNGW